jgi:hypothetical protein
MLTMEDNSTKKNICLTHFLIEGNTWDMLDNRWLCSAKSWLPRMSAFLLSPQPILHVLLPQWSKITWSSSPLFLSLKKWTAYSVPSRRVPAWGRTFPNQRLTDFQIRFWLVVCINSISSKIRCWLAGSRLLAVASHWGKNGCDTSTYFFCMYNFGISLWPSSWTCVLLTVSWMPRKRVN